MPRHDKDLLAGLTAAGAARLLGCERSEAVAALERIAGRFNWIGGVKLWDVTCEDMPRLREALVKIRAAGRCRGGRALLKRLFRGSADPQSIAPGP